MKFSEYLFRSIFLTLKGKFGIKFDYLSNWRRGQRYFHCSRKNQNPTKWLPEYIVFAVWLFDLYHAKSSCTILFDSPQFNCDKDHGIDPKN